MWETPYVFTIITVRLCLAKGSGGTGGKCPSN